MEKRNGFLTFLLALIPGVGYMYLGLIRKGVQFLVLFLLAPRILDIIGLNFLSGIVWWAIWLYTFFDTLSTARRIDKGESVHDVDFIFKKYMDEGSYPKIDSEKVGKNFWLIVSLILIGLGVLAILHNFFDANPLYIMIRHGISQYFFPALLIVAGAYILIRHRS